MTQITTATEPKALAPLTPAEQQVFQDLLARSSAGQAPAVRIGDPYQALVNLSVPRRGDPQRLTDLVLAGETVNLTPDEAEALNRHGWRDGRRIPVLRPMKEAREPLPQIHPKMVSGSPLGPPAGARPDPAGSSAVQVMQDVTIPEANEPELGSENDLRQTDPDAEDIPPARTRARRPPTRNG